MIKRHHPTSRLERLQLKKRDFIKQSRRYGSVAASSKGSSDEYPGTTDATNKDTALQDGDREEKDQP